MGRINSYPNVTRPSKNDEVIIDGSSGTRNVKLGDLAIELGGMISPVMHKNIYRYKYIGDSFTDSQKTAINNGTFDDLFIGDYWVINGVYYKIVDMDYWYNTGDSKCTKHHLVIMVDGVLYSHNMNDTNTTVGGYTGSKMYTEGLEQAKTTINAAFGEAYILNHREYLTNAVTDGHPSGGAWFDSTVELPNEIMIYGSQIFTAKNTGKVVPNLYTIDKQQLAGFRMNSQLANLGLNYWLRDVVSASYFAYVNDGGYADCYDASNVYGVRPVFGIHG